LLYRTGKREAEEKSMKKIKASNENEMIYEFLKMELNSDRYGEQIETILKGLNLDRNIIINGNLESADENVMRAIILKRFRGYRDTALFKNFPEVVMWIWTSFDTEDINKIQYIKTKYWNELSNHTSSPLEAAKTILSSPPPYNETNDRYIKRAQEIKQGHVFPPLIFLTDCDEQRYIVLEGHVRVTAYALVPDLFQNVPVLLGYCDSESLCKWYGEVPANAKTSLS